MSGAPAARADSSGGGGGGGGGSDQSSSPGRLLSIPKEGERIIAPTRRPDGTYRKAIRIRAGYVPQEEVAIYQSKGTLLKKAQPEGPPGCDPELLVKPKSKSAKRNEKKKEKRQQVALTSSADKGVDLGPSSAEADVGPSNEVDPHRKDAVDSISGQIKSMVISGTPSAVDPTIDSADSSVPESGPSDIDKKIRALKKKIRLAEGQLQGDQQNFKPEQLEKLKKIDGWRQELKLLEEKKETLSS